MTGETRIPASQRERPWKGISYLVTEPAGLVFEGDLVKAPYRLPDGAVWNWRVLAPNGRCWWETPGLELIPLGLETLPPIPKRDGWALLIGEGESDCLALREAFAGVGTGSDRRGYAILGLPGAGTWRPSFGAFTYGFESIYVVGDGDAAGRRMLDAVCRDLPNAHPIFLPEGEDARSLLQRKGSRALDVFLRRADELAFIVAALLGARDYDHFVTLLDERTSG